MILYWERQHNLQLQLHTHTTHLIFRRQTLSPSVVHIHRKTPHFKQLTVAHHWDSGPNALSLFFPAWPLYEFPLRRKEGGERWGRLQHLQLKMAAHTVQRNLSICSVCVAICRRCDSRDTHTKKTRNTNANCVRDQVTQHWQKYRLKLDLKKTNKLLFNNKQSFSTSTVDLRFWTNVVTSVGDYWIESTLVPYK